MKPEERLLHLGALLLWVGVPLACWTGLADAVVVPKSALFVVAALTVVFAWLVGAGRGAWPWLRTSTLTGVWVAFFAWWAGSALWGLGGREGWIAGLEHGLSLLLLLALTATGTPDRWRLWWRFLLVAGLLVTAYAWLQRLGLDFTVWNHPEYSVVRTISTMGNPNYLALFLVGWLPLMLPLVVPRKALWVPWLLAFAALVQTGTRGAWIACVVCLIVALTVRPARLVLAVGASMLLVGTVVVSLGAPVLSQRAQTSSVGDRDVAARVYLWKAGVATLLAHPLGVGPGGFTGEALLYRQWEPMEIRPWQRLAEHPHNQVLSVATDAGWPGALLLLAGVGLFLRDRWRAARGDLTELALLLTGIGLSVHLLSLSLALSAEVLWLAALAWPGQRDPAAPRRPPWLLVGLAGLVWIGGSVVAAGWVAGERALWWGDEYRARAWSSPEPGPVLDRAVASYLRAEPLVQPQRRADVLGALGALYADLAARLANPPELIGAAREALEQAAALDPRNPYRFASLAQLAIQSGGSGEENLREALRRDPRSPVFWALLGEDQLRRGQLREGEESLRRSLEIFPDHPGTLNRHGDVLIELGRVEEGRKLKQRAAELDPRPAP